MMRLLKIIIVALCVWGAIDGWQMRELECYLANAIGWTHAQRSCRAT